MKANMKKKYHSKNHSKYTLTYHIIFTCKYRKKLLIKYGEDIKQIMFDISRDYGVLKQQSTIQIWRIYKKELRKHYWKENTFWTDGYFVSTIGEVSSKTLYTKSRMKGGVTMQTIINRGYKFKILPTEKQKNFFMQSFGCARKIYNLYVSELYEQLEKSAYETGFIDRRSLKISQYSDFKKRYDYMKSVDAQCLSSAKMDFNNAITKFNKEYDKKTYTKRSRKREKHLESNRHSKT